MFTRVDSFNLPITEVANVRWTDQCQTRKPAGVQPIDAARLKLETIDCLKI